MSTDLTDGDLQWTHASRITFMAQEWMFRGRIDMATRLLKTARLLYRLRPGDCAEKVSFYFAEAAIAQKLGKSRTMLRAARASLVTAKRVYPPGHPTTLIAQANFGEAMATTGRLAKGRKIIADALAALKALDVSDKTWQSQYPDAIGQVQHMLDQLPEASTPLSGAATRAG